MSKLSELRYNNNKIYYLILLLYISFPTILYGVDDSIQYTYARLDQIMEAKPVYEGTKKDTISLLVNRLDKVQTPVEKYSIYIQLFNEYEAYNFDSAYQCAEKLIKLATEMKDQNREIESRMLMAYCTISAGLYLESNEIIQGIDTTKINIGHKVFLNSISAKLNLDMATSLDTKPYTSHYYKLSIHYNEMVIKLLGTGNPLAIPHQVNIYRCQQEYDKAISGLQKYMQTEKLSERSVTLCVGSIGQFYLLKGDTAAAIPFLCHAAISDIQAVTKETPSLSLLAGILYKQGDIERAYRYAKTALDDANFYNARHRKIEVGNVLPIIEASRFDIIEHQKDRLFTYAILVSTLVVIAFIAIIIIWKQIKQIRSARRLIQQQNNDLHQVNDKLKEVNKIKDVYIGSFFTNNFAFIDRIEDLLKIMSRKIVSRQFDDLAQQINKINLQKERELSLVSFDKIFLKIFPDFVNHFNELFDEKDKIKPNSNEELTTEIRIFALIRLGVTDSERIAKLLNYSVNTINTYKTKIKNRSAMPNEQFEQQIMDIGFGKKA